MTSPRAACVVALALAAGLACTAIFAPHDSVQRCGSADDCDATGDNRYDVVCRFDPENVGLDSTKVDKICVADFKNITCDPEKTSPVGGEDHPFKKQFDDCGAQNVACDEDKRGKLGCEPSEAGDCDPGLDEEDGICIDSSSAETIVSDQSFVGQDVRDQFCKSFFCDDTFVCDNSDPDHTSCVKCDPKKEFGSGGCGILYKNGAPAPTYVLGNDLEDQCAHEDADFDEPVFGECP